MTKIACPHPITLQGKLARLGWFDWEPTPGITDEGEVLYITLGERHVFIMTTDEALALSDEHLQKCIESAIGMTHEEACAQSVASKDTCTHPELITLPVTLDRLYGILCPSCSKQVSIRYSVAINGKFCLSAFIKEEFGETWGQTAAKTCRCTQCKSEVPCD